MIHFNRDWFSLLYFIGAKGWVYHDNLMFLPEEKKDALGFETGRCFDNASDLSQSMTMLGYDYAYVEGVANFCPSLHAWVHDRKTDAAIEVTWPEGEVAFYFGVPFDADFARSVYNYQRENPEHVVPGFVRYGCSVLTFRPLLMGKVEGYHFTAEEHRQAEHFIQDVKREFRHIKSQRIPC
jgi:hypothetical protein